MSEPLPAFDFTLAVDPIAETIEIVGAEIDLPGCDPVLIETEAAYVKKFRVQGNVGDELFKWFIQCGMTHKDAAEAIPEIKKALTEMFSRKSS